MAEFLGGPSDGRAIPSRIQDANFICVRPAGLDEYHLYLPEGVNFRYAGPCDGASGSIEHAHGGIRAARPDE